MTRPLLRLALSVVLLAGVVTARTAWPAAGYTGVASRAADAFHDSHVHLTNYVQQGIDVRRSLEIMGTRVDCSTTNICSTKRGAAFAPGNARIEPVD